MGRSEWEMNEANKVNWGEREWKGWDRIQGGKHYNFINSSIAIITEKIIFCEN